MNTAQFTPSLTSRVTALAFSTVFTLAMLLSVNHLATTDAPDAQMAQSQATSQG